MTQDKPRAAWHQDPMGRHQYRYWDGSTWTEHVADRGVRSIDRIDPVQDAEELPFTPGGAGPEQPAPDSSATTFLGSGAEPALSPSVTAASSSVPLFGVRRHAKGLQEEIARLQRLIDEHGLRTVEQLEAHRDRVEADIASAGLQLRAEQERVAQAQAERESVAGEIVKLRETAALQEFGFYDYEHPAEDSVRLSGDLEALRSQIKQAVTLGHATSATSNFTFNNSTAKGARFVRDMSKLMLRSYNAEAENCVKAVRAGNLDSAHKRLTKAMQQIERLGAMISLQITPYYHRLRLAELELAARHMQALQIEKEVERARREELREQKKAEQELHAERARLEKERSHYLNALAALEAKGDEEGAARMREQIADAEKAIADVDYRVANTRAGYVYVISNIGSFGRDVVKIGMTRRLEPMERIQELGDASVPFRFDVHALFFSSDAVTLEGRLHAHFADRRLNRVNLRREYFQATPAEVLEALKEHDVELLEYTLEPAAEEFRASNQVALTPATASDGFARIERIADSH